jgi:hypothetical protein
MEFPLRSLRAAIAVCVFHGAKLSLASFSLSMMESAPGEVKSRRNGKAQFRRDIGFSECNDHRAQDPVFDGLIAEH